MFNLVIFGPPGCGKGTQSAIIVEEYSLTHISTGDLLREEIKLGTDLGKLAKGLMDKGEFVSDEIVISMIENKLDSSKDSKGFIFDGFPRTTAQAEVLDKLLAARNQDINGVIAIDVDEEELVQRILTRGQEFGRADDQDAATIQNRIRVYHEKTSPVKEYYSNQGKVKDVVGTGCEIEEVTVKVMEVIESFK